LKITASGLQLRNVDQLAQAKSVDGITIMGRLDSVAYDGRNTYMLSIGGHTLHVPGDHPIDIRRTAVADALVMANDIAEDVADSLEAAENAA